MAAKRTVKVAMLLTISHSILLYYSHALKNDEFFEELYVKPLESGHVYFHFQFTSIWNVSLHEPDVCKFDNVTGAKLIPI